MKFCFISIIIVLALFSCKNEKSDIVKVSDTVKVERKVSEIKVELSSDKLNVNQEDEIVVDSKEIILKEKAFKAPIVVKEIADEQPLIEKEKVKAKKVIKKKTIPKKPVIEKKGRLSFHQKEFDFGFIEMDEIVDHTFKFTNTGNKDVVISNATATCGCTTPIYPFIPIEPGQSSKIDVRFNSKGRLGNQIATIKIISDAEEPIQELTIKGVVRSEIVSPSEFVDTTKQ